MKKLLFLIPPLIVAAVLLLVYFLKGIYPFGSLTVVYGDMDQHYIPFSYHIYDIFHSGKSLFWDPYMGTGSNIFGIEALSGMFSPISWLVVFTSRENIPYFASFLLMIRMALLSFTSFVFMDRMFHDTRAFWRVALSVMYAFCGYVLIFYTNMAWIDCAILFPLLLFTLRNLFDKDKIAGYLYVLSANLIISYYISFMLLLFVFFSSGVFLYFYIEKSRRKKVLLNLGIGTVGALLLTSFVTIPAFLQSTSSIRFGGFSYLGVIGTDANSSVTLNKTVVFFFAAVLLVIVFKILLNFRNNKKTVAIFGLLMGLTVIQVIVEATNILWYGGSYVCYPLRFGFIPLFLLLVGTAWYFSPGFIKKNRKPPSGDGSFPKINRIGSNSREKRRVQLSINRFPFRAIHIIYGAAALAAYLVAVYLGSMVGGEINKTLYGYWGITENLSLLFILVAILFGISIWILLMMKDTRIKYGLIGLVILTEILTHSIWYIGVPPRSNGHVDDWSIIANELHENLDINNGTISRFKDADSVMNANYPLVVGTQAVSSYLHLIEARQQKSFGLLGYSLNYTRLLDTGGTLFSDLVLNIDNVLTSKPYDQEIFDFLGKNSSFYLYRNRYALPVGIVFSTTGDASVSTDILDLKENATPFDNQNFMYQILFGQTDRIIEPVTTAPVLDNIKNNPNGDPLRFELEDTRKTGSIVYQFTVAGKSFVYLEALNTSSPIHIIVNGQIVTVPTFGSIQNTSFPASYNNGILNLGLYENESVNVEIITNVDVDFKSLVIGTLSVEKLAALSTQAVSSNSGNSAAISGNTIYVKTIATQGGQTLFLPVNYDKGWECAINGKSAVVGKVFGTFIRLDLAEGQNDIVLRFVPSGFKTGFLISGITLLLGIMILLLIKRKTTNFFTKRATKAAQTRTIATEDINLQAENIETRNPQGFGIATQNHDMGTKRARDSLISLKDGAMNAIYIVFWTIYFVAILFVYIIPFLSFFIRNLIKIFIK